MTDATDTGWHAERGWWPDSDGDYVVLLWRGDEQKWAG